MPEPKQTTLAKKSRRFLSFWERLRGWVDTSLPGEPEPFDSDRRVLNVVRRLKRHGFFTRPAQGIVIRLETAEALADLLDRIFERE